MAQFAVYRNPSRRSNKRIPYVVDVQSDLLAITVTRVVIPLALPSLLNGRAARQLNPQLIIKRKKLVLLTQEIAALPTSILVNEIANLSSQRDQIIAALDLLFTGI